MKLYHINLTEEERQELIRLTTTGRHAARKVLHARILLKADEGLKDEQIAQHLDVSVCTVERVRKRCTLDGITAALNPKKRPPGKPKLDGQGEARLVQLACSVPPDGFLSAGFNRRSPRLPTANLKLVLSDRSTKRT